MTERAEAAAARPISGSKAYIVLGSLVAGLIAGLAAGRLPESSADYILQPAAILGELWLDALKMTVIPLVVALLVTGIARSAEAARAGRVAGRTVLWIVILCTASAVVGMATIQLLLALFPLSSAAAVALSSAVSGLGGAAAPESAGLGAFLTNLMPANIFAAASAGEILPLVVFSILFALAASRIAPDRRRTIIGFFEAIADALLTIIAWVLWLAPIGVFALALTVGAAAGGAAFAGLAHYVVLVSAVGVVIAILAYPVAVIAGAVPPGRFAKAMLPPQSVAVSTRSSLASLPAMLASSRLLGIREEVADVALPIAVALFRATGPAMNAAVVFYVAHLLGHQPSAAQLLAATAVAAVMSYASVSLPGEITFISSTAPIALALGVPIEPLALLVAVEMVPDIFRTLGNVTMDVAVTSAVDRRQPAES